MCLCLCPVDRIRAATAVCLLLLSLCCFMAPMGGLVHLMCSWKKEQFCCVGKHLAPGPFGKHFCTWSLSCLSEPRKKKKEEKSNNLILDGLPLINSVHAAKRVVILCPTYLIIFICLIYDSENSEILTIFLFVWNWQVNLRAPSRIFGSTADIDPFIGIQRKLWAAHLILLFSK